MVKADNQNKYKKLVNILGATGSIGKASLDVISRYPDKFELGLVTANQNALELAEIARKYHAKYAVICDERYDAELADHLAGSGVKVAAGKDALEEYAKLTADITVAAIVGIAGLAASMNALENSKRLALANKEAIICAGNIFLQKAQQYETEILPIDSEHNGLLQAMASGRKGEIAKWQITASGGPFLHSSYDEMKRATAKQAINHPNWSMGAKISVDSATMMNKGLELIEAHYLFDIDVAGLDAIIHPESLIHALIYYHDGSVLAQCANPDMRIPISYALGYPERLYLPMPILDLTELGKLHFIGIDEQKFPAVNLAKEVIQQGGNGALVMNIANEMAVQDFLAGRIAFTDIVPNVMHMLDKHSDIIAGQLVKNLDEIIEIDNEIRKSGISNE